MEKRIGERLPYFEVPAERPERERFDRPLAEQDLQREDQNVGDDQECE
jgi:hypothetical protein